MSRLEEDRKTLYARTEASLKALEEEKKESRF
jgi:hypothetical protein